MTWMDPQQTTGAGSPVFWGSLDLGPALNHMAVSHPCAKPVLCLALKFGVGLAPDLCGPCSSLLWITGTADPCLACGSSDQNKACNRLRYKTKNDQKQTFQCVSQVYFCLLTFCLLQSRWCVGCSQKRKTLIWKWHEVSLMDLPSRPEPIPYVQR